MRNGEHINVALLKNLCDVDSQSRVVYSQSCDICSKSCDHNLKFPQISHFCTNNIGWCDSVGIQC